MTNRFVQIGALILLLFATHFFTYKAGISKGETHCESKVTTQVVTNTVRDSFYITGKQFETTNVSKPSAFKQESRLVTASDIAKKSNVIPSGAVSTFRPIYKDSLIINYMVEDSIIKNYIVKNDTVAKTYDKVFKSSGVAVSKNCNINFLINSYGPIVDASFDVDCAATTTTTTTNFKRKNRISITPNIGYQINSQTVKAGLNVNMNKLMIGYQYDVNNTKDHTAIIGYNINF